MRGWWGALGLLVCGCWRVNPAFIVGLAEQSSGDGGGDTTGEPGMSSGSDTTGGADTTTQGSGSTEGSSTAAPPGTTTGDPSTSTTTTTTTTTSETTGEPGSSTSDGSTSGGEFNEEALCLDAIDGLVSIGVPLLDMYQTPCLGQWKGSDTKMPNVTVPALCGGPGPPGFAFTKPTVTVHPNVIFASALLTGTQSLPTRSGTIEGTFYQIDLANTVHPCFLASVGCIVDQPGPCSLDVQVFVKKPQDGDWGAPLLATSISDANFYDVGLPLASFKGQTIDILLVVQNDLVGAPQEVAAWEAPVIAEVYP